jgi:hypothetical protein
MPGISVVAERPVCLCTSSSFEMCLGLLAGGVVALVLRFVFSCYRRRRMFLCLVVLLCCVGGFVPLILIVSCSGGCWSVCSGGWPSVLV